MAMLKSCLLLFTICSMGNTEEPYLGNTNATECPAEWTSFGLGCYKYFSDASNWITAQRNCQSHGANLASVSNKVENDFLLSLLSSSTRTWIGANDAVQDGQWLWSDGSASSYTNWCSGEPNNYQQHPEDCLEINFTADRCWNDESCSTSLSYICVIDMCDCVTTRRRW